MIVLIGFMGAGKSTVGALLAERLQLPFVDVDRLVEWRTGRTVAELFHERGERHFRTLEREAVAEALTETDAVVALGGGAVEDPATATALEWADVVLLDVSYSEAMRRVRNDGERPMLAAPDTRALYDSRRDLYQRIARQTVSTDDRRPIDVVEDIVERLGELASRAVRKVPVPIPGREYTVTVGGGAAGRLDVLLPALSDAEMAFVVTQASVKEARSAVLGALERRRLHTVECEVPDGERSKSLAVAERLYDQFSAAGAHRHDVVVAVGGGVVCDLAGFVASTYHRGMPVLHVPTTLLAQVDAAIGGKTAVNLRTGRNQVGTIHQPIAVVCDVTLLKTLPPQEVSSGMAEVVKYGLIADPSLLEVIESRANELDGAEPQLMTELVARSVAIKAGFVVADEREGGRRAHLNYGHTFAHALEQSFGWGTLRHGEAVALGMMAAAYLGHELGRLSDEDVALHRRVLRAVGLPTAIECDLEALERAWRHDKKYRGGVRFVILKTIGRAEAGIAPPRPALERAVERLRT